MFRTRRRSNAGLFDEELVPEELTQVRMGKIVGAKFPELDAEDQEAVRQHAVAALEPDPEGQGGRASRDDSDEVTSGNTALIDGVRKFAMDVRELDIDLIDRINPFGEAYCDPGQDHERGEPEAGRGSDLGEEGAAFA